MEPKNMRKYSVLFGAGTSSRQIIVWTMPTKQNSGTF